ncbi:MAG: LysM peptidoglycan-binding domain-containing protein [Solirubrobacterales bacterium]
MPDQGTSQTARVIAVAGLIGAFVLVVFVIATSGGGGDDNGDTSATGVTRTGPDTSDPKVVKAIEKGEWEVEEGDTLTAIAEATGIEEDTLATLNPDIDPQALIPGQRVKLR